MEVDMWLKKHFRPFPKIGQLRLPLHHIVELSPKEAFKFVFSEFQLESYCAWIEVAKVFKFSADNIRIITVKNTMQVGETCTLYASEIKKMMKVEILNYDFILVFGIHTDHLSRRKGITQGSL